MGDPRDLNIYVDGSAFRNPGHESGVAVVADYPEDMNKKPELVYSQGYSKSTNNRMELVACIIDYVKNTKTPVTIFVLGFLV